MQNTRVGHSHTPCDIPSNLRSERRPLPITQSSAPDDMKQYL